MRENGGASAEGKIQIEEGRDGEGKGPENVQVFE